MSACTCAPCGREFSCVSAFDRHQVAAYGTADPVSCLDPAPRGLVIDRYGRWAWPPSGDSGRPGFPSRILRPVPAVPGTGVTPGRPGAPETPAGPSRPEAA